MALSITGTPTHIGGRAARGVLKISPTMQLSLVRSLVRQVRSHVTEVLKPSAARPPGHPHLKLFKANAACEVATHAHMQSAYLLETTLPQIHIEPKTLAAARRAVGQTRLDRELAIHNVREGPTIDAMKKLLKDSMQFDSSSTKIDWKIDVWETKDENEMFAYTFKDLEKDTFSNVTFLVDGDGTTERVCTH